MSAGPESGGSAPRVLMLVPSYAKEGTEDAVAADRHPTMDYHALQRALGADMADYAVLDRDRGFLVRMGRRAGRDAGLAMHGFLRRRAYDVVYTNGENVSIPLAALLSLTRRRPGHVTIGHRLSAPKKRVLLRRLSRHIDTLFVYARTQQAYAAETLKIPAGKLRLIPFHADHRFYRPCAPASAASGAMICSAGLEWRDYPTLIEAVTGLDVEVRLGAASPWSKHVDETRRRALPPNVSARRYEYGELRDLYAEARFVVVPLYENDFQAGVTTILEAMAMGKAVVASRTTGQGDVIEHGVNGLYVPPGDPSALRAAIVGLLERPDEAARMGEAARRSVEQSMTLDHWVDRVASGICAAARHAPSTLRRTTSQGGV